jgi:hypothetical protein
MIRETIEAATEAEQVTPATKAWLECLLPPLPNRCLQVAGEYFTTTEHLLEDPHRKCIVSLQFYPLTVRISPMLERKETENVGHLSEPASPANRSDWILQDIPAICKGVSPNFEELLPLPKCIVSNCATPIGSGSSPEGYSNQANFPKISPRPKPSRKERVVSANSRQPVPYSKFLAVKSTVLIYFPSRRRGLPHFPSTNVEGRDLSLMTASILHVQLYQCAHVKMKEPSGKGAHKSLKYEFYL